MGVTTKDLARICGVSLGTIDRALRNRPGIRKETRDMILASAKEHGYKPNIVARNLKRGRTFEVGLVVHDLDNEFFAELVNSIQETAWARQYYLQIAVSRRQAKRERTALEHMAERNVDGILLFPAGSGDEFDEFLHGLDRPIVTIANKVSPSWPFVGLSDRRVMRDLTSAIIKKGYERLVFVGPLRAFDAGINLYELEERYSGFLEAAARKPEVELLLLGGTDFVEELRKVDLRKKRTAVICCSDIFALDVLNDLRIRGFSVPQDVGLMGFDAIDALRFINPRLSTVEYPIQRMGEIAFSMLIDKPALDASFIELEPTIVWGDSV